MSSVETKNGGSEKKRRIFPRSNFNSLNFYQKMEDRKKNEEFFREATLIH
jgi:hypothetical protein